MVTTATAGTPNLVIAPRKFPTSGFNLIPSTDKVEEERLPTYEPNAYYPMKIGDVIRDRYQVVAKLGYGVTSTVWLCRDLTQEKKYWALKVYINKVKEAHELDVFKHLRAVVATSKHPGRGNIRHLEDSFTISGPKGDHIVMVLAPLGMSLKSLQEQQESRVFSPRFAKAVVQNTLLGLDFLQEEANVIHTDIHLDNLLISLRRDSLLESIEEDELQTPGQRKIAHDGKVIHISKIFLDGIGPINITDFGQARIGDVCVGPAMSTQYRAPEVILGMPWGKEVDNWSIGLATWDLLEPKPLFTVYDRDDASLNDARHLAAMTALLGNQPREFLDRSRETKKY